MVARWPIFTVKGSHQLELAAKWVAVLGIVFFSGSFLPLFKLTQIVPFSLVSNFQKLVTVCFLLISLFSILYLKRMGRDFQRYKFYSYWALVVFVVWMTMSLSWTLAPSGRALYFGLLISSTAFSFFLAMAFTFRQTIRLVSIAFMIILGASLLFNALFTATFAILKEPLSYDIESLIINAGIFTNKNILARTMAFATLFWAFQSYVSRDWKRWFWLVMSGVAIFVVERASSLTAIVTICTIAATAVILWMLHSRWFKSNISRALFLASGFVVCLVLVIEFSVLIAEYTTLEGRLQPWKILIAGAQIKFAFGVGLGGFWHDQEGLWRTVDLGSRMMHSHNGFLDIWLELGAVGVLIFVTIVVLIAYDLWLSPTHPSSEKSIFFTLFMAGFVVYNLFESSILPVNSAATLLWIIMVWLILECDKRRNSVMPN